MKALLKTKSRSCLVQVENKKTQDNLFFVSLNPKKIILHISRLQVSPQESLPINNNVSIDFAEARLFYSIL